MTDTATPTKPATRKQTGPLRPEPPHKLGAGSGVTTLDGRTLGKVKTIMPGDRYLVEWVDGETTTEPRGKLLSRFTSETPAPRRKGGRR